MHVGAGLVGGAGVQPCLHRLHGDLRAFLLRESEHAGGDAAERHRLRLRRTCRIQAADIALRQLFALLKRRIPLRHGADRVDDVPRGKVIGGRDLRTADRLLVALLSHDLRALQAQLHAGEGVDGVVDAEVPGDPAAQKRAVRGVDDGVAAQGRDVPAPDAQARVGGGARKLVGFGDARFGDHELENAILHLQKLRRSGLRLARVHQRAELLPLLHEPARVLLRLNALTPRAPFIHQVIYQEGHILYQLHHGARISLFASPSCRAGRWRRARALRRPPSGHIDSCWIE